MPQCSIINCKSWTKKFQPQLTYHRLPTNEEMKKKWLDIIGVKNLNPFKRNHLICSLHFKESNFNRTLDVGRLHDNAMPSIFLMPHYKPGAVSKQISLMKIIDSQLTAGAQQTNRQENRPRSQGSCNMAAIKLQESMIRIQRLTQKCKDQRRYIKCLHERVRKRNNKIAVLHNMIKAIIRIKNQ